MITLQPNHLSQANQTARSSNHDYASLNQTSLKDANQTNCESIFVDLVILSCNCMPKMSLSKLFLPTQAKFVSV